MVYFYRWLRKFASQQTKKHVTCNIRCPLCKTWTSEVEHSIIDNLKWGYHLECGQCGNQEYYNAVAFPFPHLADENGNPAQEKKGGA